MLCLNLGAASECTCKPKPLIKKFLAITLLAIYKNNYLMFW